MRKTTAQTVDRENQRAICRSMFGKLSASPNMRRMLDGMDFPNRHSWRVLKEFHAIGRTWKVGEIIPSGKRAPFLKRMKRRGFIEICDVPPVQPSDFSEKPAPVKPVDAPVKAKAPVIKRVVVKAKKKVRVPETVPVVGQPARKRGRPKKVKD